MKKSELKSIIENMVIALTVFGLTLLMCSTFFN
jgi:hypothetical protein